MLDWEEALLGTDPTKRDSDDDGIADNIEMAEARAALEQEGNPYGEFGTAEEENLSRTEEFSRELFATAASLSQVGEVEGGTADLLSESLVEEIQNEQPDKVYVLAEINVGSDNSSLATEKYIADINKIYTQYPSPQVTALDALSNFAGNGEAENVEALEDLRPLIEQTGNVIREMALMSVPSDLAALHLDVINSLQRLKENLEDILMFEFDPIVAMGGVGRYGENSLALEDALTKLGAEITKKLGN